MKTEGILNPRKTPRTGVFICTCGDEISAALDVARIEECCRKLNGVVHVAAERYPCSRPGLAAMLEVLKESGLERVIVAGCSARLHGKLFQDACQNAGLNRWFVEMVNIREHCSLVHGDRGGATEKAIDLIRASVEKAALARPFEPVRVTPEKTILIIGGGIAGLTAAGELVGLGHEVTLIEKTGDLGGALCRFSNVYPDDRSARDVVQRAVARVDGKARILKRTELSSLRGGPGQYRVTLTTAGSTDAGAGELRFGAVIVATGADTTRSAELLDGLSSVGGEFKTFFAGLSMFRGRVLTHLDLETGGLEKGPSGKRSVLFINSAPGGNGPGARLYSLVALKNAILLKQAAPALELSFVFDDIPSEYERDFRKARDLGVGFVRRRGRGPLEFTGAGLRLSVASDAARGAGGENVSGDAGLESAGWGNVTEIKADIVVLPSFLKSHAGACELGRILRIPVDPEGFFIEPHVKLRPGDFLERGIFVAGSCHAPATIFESISQAMAAAVRASAFLGQDVVKAPFVSAIDERICRGCSRCADTCEWDAIEMLELENGLKLGRVDETLCSGCGVCSAVCICGAPSLAPVTAEQAKAMVDTLGAGGRR